MSVSARRSNHLSSNHLSKLAIHCLILSACCAVAFGQTESGSLSGVVLDPGHAVIAGASVDVTSAADGVTLHTVSNDAGIYLFPSLPPGQWTVTAEKAGFKKLVRTEIQIFVAQRQTLDLQLEVGDVKQSVEVTSNQTLLDTETSEKGQTLTPRMYQTLPLWNGGLQNPSAFLGYMAGVNNGSETSIAGSTGRAREQLIDGTSNVIPESGGTVFNPPSAEAFSEFKLLVGTYTAEYGRTGGGIEILNTKSGTNDYHGTWVYSMRRDIWEAAGWSVNQNPANAPGTRPKDRLNETGGGVGGPVYIPKVYDGRNKTFFYFSDDNDLRPVAPTAIVNTVPTRSRHRGTSARFRKLSTIRPPTTSGANPTRSPFPGQHHPDEPFQQDLGEHHPLHSRAERIRA